MVIYFNDIEADKCCVKRGLKMIFNRLKLVHKLINVI